MPGKLLDDEISNQLGEIFNSDLQNRVEILYFSKDTLCGTCDEVQLLLEEVTAISDKLHLSIYNLDGNPEIATKYHVELAPGLVIAGLDGDKIIDYGIRFSGIPSGYEFSSFIQVLLLVSKRDSGLKPETRKKLHELSEPVHLKVFVTPT